MLEAFRNWVLSILRVPPEPHQPEGSAGSIRVFRAGRNFYRWQVLGWAASHFGLLFSALAAFIALSQAIRKAPAWVQQLFVGLELLGLAAVLFTIPVTFIALRWNYELRWYIVTDRSLRIRRGVWNVEELTMTFANIQEIRVKSGPIQHLLGLADVEVLAAGGGVGAHGESTAHKAVFEGVDNAAEIRELMVERLRIYRDLGLGGPVEHQASPASAESTRLEAARAVLQEASALRAALQRPPAAAGSA